ncbi:MAG: hypothetical protein JST84_10220 [Acidobacteria bacterium]|nr:hypothetical protein [Acidobacteriota bacterium]
MQKIAACIVCLMAFVAATYAQAFESVPAPAESNLIGTINGKLKIRMKLTKQGEHLTGTYAYDTQKKNIVVRGLVNEQGYFELTEYGAKDYPTGYFVGAFTRDNVVVGFWGKDESSLSAKLPVRLVEDAKATVGVNNKFEVISANVKSDHGGAQILLIDDAVIAFYYENVGANAHTCTLTVDRSETGVQWKTEGQTTTLNFTKEYINIDENTAKVVIQKRGVTYTITFDGYVSYFCGARAMLPSKVTLRKGSKGWIGQE